MPKKPVIDEMHNALVEEVRARTDEIRDRMKRNEPRDVQPERDEMTGAAVNRRSRDDGQKLVERLYYATGCATPRSGLDIERLRLVDRALAGEIHAYNAGADIDPTLHVLSNVRQLAERMGRLEQLVQFLVQRADER